MPMSLRAAFGPAAETEDEGEVEEPMEVEEEPKADVAAPKGAKEALRSPALDVGVVVT